MRQNFELSLEELILEAIWINGRGEYHGVGGENHELDGEHHGLGGKHHGLVGEHRRLVKRSRACWRSPSWKEESEHLSRGVVAESIQL